MGNGEWGDGDLIKYRTSPPTPLLTKERGVRRGETLTQVFRRGEVKNQNLDVI